MKKTMLFVVLVVVGLLAGCQAVSGNFVVAVDDALAVIVPRYKDYISKDTQFSADDVKTVLQSCDELMKMVKEERARQEE